ncbi:MAG TPA: HD domain-containing protein, partial [Candidatus Paceibacterota bacterium]|nr:HD domain-containing protein [Candidatus Paceibacterota bacterium]
MRTVQDIYDAYRIMPALQLHQLRVAACAQQICDSLTADVAGETVVTACLFHDMANIIKSDLETFPDFLEPEGKAHWQIVKEEFIAKYGSDEHHAAIQICREVGIPEASITIIDHIGFSQMRETARLPLEIQIGEYCDLRVGPHGVISMQARMDEATARYRGRYSDIPRAQEEYEVLVAAAYQIEQQIFAEA